MAARALARAAVALTPIDALCAWLTAVVVAAMLAAAVNPALSVPVALAGLVAGPVGVRIASGRADERVVLALPAALDRIAAELRAGGTVAEAVRGFSLDDGPVAPDLGRVATRLELGIGLNDALANWRRERPLPGVDAVAGALSVAGTLGGASAGALEGLAASLRARAAATSEARALSAQSRASAVVVGLAPIGYLAFASAADPGSVSVLLDRGVGRICLALGLAMETCAALWMRALLRRST